MKQIYKKMQFEANFERHDDPEFYRSKKYWLFNEE